MRDLSDLTIAICTRNRAHFLRMCLDGLLTSAASFAPRILVIDNDSSDETQFVLAEYADRVRMVHEPKIGLSNARNRALTECSTNYIAFLDDDGIPDRTWASGIAKLLDRFDPDVFGGPFTPFYLEPKPNWHDDCLGSAHLDLAEGLQKFGTCFSGGNMGWKTSLVRNFGGFNPKLGMSGQKLKLGEETALQLAIWRNVEKPIFAFSPAMSMRHYVHPEKMSLAYIAKRNFIYGFQLYDIDQASSLIRTSTLTLLIRGRFGLPILVRLLWRDRRRYPFWKSFAATYLSLHAISLGVITRRLVRQH